MLISQRVFQTPCKARQGKARQGKARQVTLGLILTIVSQFCIAADIDIHPPTSAHITFNAQSALHPLSVKWEPNAGLTSGGRISPGTDVGTLTISIDPRDGNRVFDKVSVLPQNCTPDDIDRIDLVTDIIAQHDLLSWFPLRLRPHEIGSDENKSTFDYSISDAVASVKVGLTVSQPDLPPGSYSADICVIATSI
ncbi:hypothetical protein DMZ75_24270 [Salmonella enterica subsp. diarizonae]|nr:hypothetical protein [Salmonella enterica subsp. diarizonae]